MSSAQIQPAALVSLKDMATVASAPDLKANVIDLEPSGGESADALLEGILDITEVTACQEDEGRRERQEVARIAALELEAAKANARRLETEARIVEEKIRREMARANREALIRATYGPSPEELEAEKRAEEEAKMQAEQEARLEEAEKARQEAIERAQRAERDLEKQQTEANKVQTPKKDKSRPTTKIIAAVAMLLALATGAAGLAVSLGQAQPTSLPAAAQAEVSQNDPMSSETSDEASFNAEENAATIAGTAMTVVVADEEPTKKSAKKRTRRSRRSRKARAKAAKTVDSDTTTTDEVETSKRSFNFDLGSETDIFKTTAF